MPFDEKKPVLEVRNLVIDYGTGRRAVRVVDDVSFTIGEGETLGVVGESGSGKTTIARAILGLVPVTGGSIVFRGRDVTHLRGRARRAIAAQLQSVFQDPYASFNPSLRVGVSLTEGLEATGASRADATERMRQLLDRVGLSPDAASQFPSRFSGGQRQRLAIARALMTSPALIVCDEPVSALDVSVQAQVLNLLRRLRREAGLSYLFIGHDIDVMRYMSDRLLVLYRGRVQEEGDAEQVANRPRSAYARTLLAATPELDPRAADAPSREQIPL